MFTQICVLRKGLKISLLCLKPCGCGATGSRGSPGRDLSLGVTWKLHKVTLFWQAEPQELCAEQFSGLPLLCPHTWLSSGLTNQVQAQVPE